LKETVKCEFCGKSFDSPRQLRKDPWSYRLSALFSQTRDKESPIPVALALLQIKHCVDMSSQFVDTTGIDFSWSTAAGEIKNEIDFLVMTKDLYYCQSSTSIKPTFAKLCCLTS
jgi:hypothetical protein